MLCLRDVEMQLFASYKYVLKIISRLQLQKSEEHCFFQQKHLPLCLDFKSTERKNTL